jgi:tRNA(Ile)-lysidine synthase
MANSRNNKPPADLQALVSDCLDRYVRAGDRLAAALSGGIDSVLLLHVLRALSGEKGFLLSALHVNHGISPHADRWQAFCEQLCEDWAVPLHVRRVVVEPGGGSGLEAAARRARYAAFADMEADWLALAHHRDDQAETLLLNLLRGAGLAGAAAMPTVRDCPGRPGLRLIRPLLAVSRADIERHARAAGLTWIDDDSNTDDRHTRNFLRSRVVPLLRQRFAGCETALARAASHFAEGEHLLNELARIDAERILREGRIVVSRLALLEDARARNLLRFVMRSAGVVPPESTTLHEIVRQLCSAAADRQLRFFLGNAWLHRYRGEAWLTPHAEPGGDMDWQGESRLRWGSRMLRFEAVTGMGISRNKLGRAAVRITARRGGERLQPDCQRPRRTLKKLLQEHAVPPWERERLPLLWCGPDLVWVPGIGIDCAWQCAAGEPGILPGIESLPAGS